MSKVTKGICKGIGKGIGKYECDYDEYDDNDMPISTELYNKRCVGCIEDMKAEDEFSWANAGDIMDMARN